MRPLRILLGLCIWAVLGWAVWQAAAGDRLAGLPLSSWRRTLWNYATGHRQTTVLKLPAPRTVAVGDPIFAADASGQLHQVGEIISLLGTESSTNASPRLSPRPVRQAQVEQAQALFYPSTQPQAGAWQVTYLESPQSLAWVVETLLPPQRRKELAAELSAAVNEHREEVHSALLPLVEQSFRDSVHILEDDLPVAIERHRDELQAIGRRYHQDLVDKELVPLVQREIWPIVRQHSEPTMNEVGQEMWDRLSLWRFGWRLAYDASPLPRKNLVEQEWKRFVDREAMPVLTAHSAEFMEVVQNILRDTARNPAVRSTLQQGLEQALDDPELRRVLGAIFREAVVDNPRWREALVARWTSPEAKAALQLASSRLEPVVRRMADRIIGTPEAGISPQLAQVLRNQILAKDRRWFLVEAVDAQSGPTIDAAPDAAGNPTKHLPDSMASPAGNAEASASAWPGEILVRLPAASRASSAPPPPEVRRDR